MKTRVRLEAPRIREHRSVVEPIHSSRFHAIMPRAFLGALTFVSLAACSSKLGDSDGPQRFLELVIAEPWGGNWITSDENRIELMGYARGSSEITSIRWETSAGVTGEATSTSVAMTSRWYADGIPLEIGDNTITVTAASADGRSASARLIVSSNPGIHFNSGLRLNPREVWVDTPTEVHVTIAIAPGMVIDREDIRLVALNESNHAVATLTYLTDDGDPVSGDATANDHQYSGRFTVDEAVALELRVRVMIGRVNAGSLPDAQSEVVVVPVMVKPTEEEMTLYSETLANIAQKYSELAATQNQDEAIRRTLSWARALPRVVALGSRSDEGRAGISFSMDFGPRGDIVILESAAEGALPPSRPEVIAAPEVGPNPRNYKVGGSWVLFPGNRRFFILDAFAGTLHSASDILEQLFRAPVCGKTWDTTRYPTDRSNATIEAQTGLEAFKRLHKYGAIYITSHGGTAKVDYCKEPPLFDPACKMLELSAISTGQRYAAQGSYSDYLFDLKKGRVTIRLQVMDGVIGSDKYYGITPWFIDFYYSLATGAKFPGSVVFLDACYSSLATEFYDRQVSFPLSFNQAGARFTAGFDDFTRAGYAAYVAQYFWSGYLGTNHNAHDALEIAKDMARVSTAEPPESSVANGLGDPLLWLFDPGIENGSFETGDTTGWQSSSANGVYTVVETWEGQSSRDGSEIGIIAIGDYRGVYGDELGQPFCVPPGATRLVFDYNIIPEGPILTGANYRFSVAIVENQVGFQEILVQPIDETNWMQIQG
jgi:hypothetical protein